MTSLKAFLEAGDKFAARSGIELVSVSPGEAVTRLVVQPWHLNAVGAVQGGAIFTLADFAFAAASNSHGTVAVGINVSITFQTAASSGVISAHAREVSSNAKLATYVVTVTDEAGRVVALFQGLAYRKQAPIPPTDAGQRAES